VKQGIKIPVEGIDEKLIRQTMLTYVIAILLVMVGIFFVLPKFNDLVVIKNEIKKNESKIKGMQQGLDVLDSLNKTITTGERELLEKALPSVYQLSIVLGGLRQLSQNLEVNVIDYVLEGGRLTKEGENKEDKSWLKKTKLKLKVAGQTSAVMEFMKQVEETIPLSSITDVSVTTMARMLKDDPTKGMVSLSLEIEYYYLPLAAGEKYEVSKYLINEKDLAVLETLKRYQQPYLDKAVKVEGGNQDLFGE